MTHLLQDGAYYCYCAYVLRISRYSDFLSPMHTNSGIFLRSLKPGMALGFFNLGPGTRMFGQVGVSSIFWESQNLGDPLREKEYVLGYEKKRVTNLELILTHMHMLRTGGQKLFLEPLHSFLDKNSVNERAPFPRVFCYIFAFSDLQSTFL